MPSGKSLTNESPNALSLQFMNYTGNEECEEKSLSS